MRERDESHKESIKYLIKRRFLNRKEQEEKKHLIEISITPYILQISRSPQLKKNKGNKITSPASLTLRKKCLSVLL